VEPGPDGARVGELVITHLYRGAKPLVRYRTGDLVRLLPPAGAADYPSPVLQPLGRARDVLTINGEPTYAYDLEQTVLAHVSRCFGYQIIIEDVDGVDRLTLRLECLDPSGVDEPALRETVLRRYGSEPVVSLENVGGIAGTAAMVSWKASRVHDRRVDDDAERKAALAIAARRDAR
jgi:phenylacetate-CoA ligase